MVDAAAAFRSDAVAEIHIAQVLGAASLGLRQRGYVLFLPQLLYHRIPPAAFRRSQIAISAPQSLIIPGGQAPGPLQLPILVQPIDHQDLTQPLVLAVSRHVDEIGRSQGQENSQHRSHQVQEVRTAAPQAKSEHQDAVERQDQGQVAQSCQTVSIDPDVYGHTLGHEHRNQRQPAPLQDFVGPEFTALRERKIEEGVHEKGDGRKPVQEPHGHGPQPHDFAQIQVQDEEQHADARQQQAPPAFHVAGMLRQRVLFPGNIG